MKIFLVGMWLLSLFEGPVSDRRVEDGDLDFVEIREPYNPADENGYGPVPYAYRITREQINNELYVRFLNAVDPAGTNGRALYRSEMTDSQQGGIVRNSRASAGRRYAVKPGYASRPVVFVNWRDAARFTNWVRNGGRKGSSTEIGTYNLRESDRPGRNRGGNYWIPCENEIYKAGFYRPSGGGRIEGGGPYLGISSGPADERARGAIALRVRADCIQELVDPAIDPPAVRNARVVFAGRIDPEAENGETGFRLAGALTAELAEEREQTADTYAGAPGSTLTPALPAFFGSGAGGGNSPTTPAGPPPAS